MYTLESLKEINLARHYINESVVTHINQCITEIKNDRNTATPTYGDIVRYTDKYGTYYGKASVQPADGFTGENEINICQSGSHGHYYKHHISTSGGPWCNIDKSHFKLIGKATASFWVWGYNGACANGGVDFVTEVNLWECNLNEQEYSTEFYDRQYITDVGEDKKRDGYRWFGQGIAFRNESDYIAWLKTFKGICQKGHSESQTIVWFYKETRKGVSLEEFNSIEGISDTFLCNGVRECKRIYDDTNKTVTTYYTWALPELPWQLNREYRFARTVK